MERVDRPLLLLRQGFQESSHDLCIDPEIRGRVICKTIVDFQFKLSLIV